MIILENTTDTIQARLSGIVSLNQLPCVTSYRDITNSTFTPGRKLSLTNDTTDINLVDAPAASTQRVIDYISIYNSDIANATIEIFYDISGVEYMLFHTTLAPLEKLEFQEGQGFKTISSSGAVKQSINQGTNVSGTTTSAVVLAADVINNNAVANTIQDVTGLSFPVNAGHTYYFYACIDYTAAATTTGSRWTISGPAFTRLSYSSQSSATATSMFFNSGLTAYDLPAAASTSSASTTGNNAYVEGFITPSANGTVIVRFASEILSSAITAKAGSVLFYQQVL